MTKSFARLAWKRGGQRRKEEPSMCLQLQVEPSQRTEHEQTATTFCFLLSFPRQAKLLPIPQVCCCQNFISFVTFVFEKS